MAEKIADSWPLKRGVGARRALGEGAAGFFSQMTVEDIWRETMRKRGLTNAQLDKFAKHVAPGIQVDEEVDEEMVPVMREMIETLAVEKLDPLFSDHN